MSECTEMFVYEIQPAMLDKFISVKDQLIGEARTLPGLVESATFRADAQENLFVDRMIWESADAATAGAELFQGLPTVVVDHHPVGPDPIPGISFRDPGACAAGEMVFDLISGKGGAWPRATVDGLYVAILSDTGSFRFSNTTPGTLRLAADLVALGADPGETIPPFGLAPEDLGAGGVMLLRIRFRQGADVSHDPSNLLILDCRLTGHCRAASSRGYSGVEEDVIGVRLKLRGVEGGTNPAAAGLAMAGSAEQLESTATPSDSVA